MLSPSAVWCRVRLDGMLQRPSHWHERRLFHPLHVYAERPLSLAGPAILTHNVMRAARGCIRGAPVPGRVLLVVDVAERCRSFERLLCLPRPVFFWLAVLRFPFFLPLAVAVGFPA